MKRVALLLGLLLTLPAFAQQDTAQAVTYRRVAAPASRIVAELSKLTGLKLEVTPQTENDILVIDVQGVPLSALMQRIATAVAGEWQPIEGGYRLVANAAVRTREAQTERARKIASLRAEIAVQAEQLKPRPEKKKPVTPPAGTEGEAEPDEPTDPRSMPIARLLQGIDPAILADIGTDGRVVFSTVPTRMQRPLPGRPGPIIAEYVTAHNENVKVRAAAGEEAMPDGDEVPAAWRQIYERRMRPIDRPVAKALLVVHPNAQFGGGRSESLRLELRLYDAQGVLLGSEEGTLIPDRIRLEERPSTPGPKPGDAPTAGTPIEWSEDTKQFVAMVPNFGAEAESMSFKMPPALRAKLFAPETYDPLSFFASDPLLSLAKLKKRPLVACLPDTAMSFSGILVSSQIGGNTVESYLESLKAGDEMTLSEDEGWLLVRPASPDAARSRRFDRASLGALMRAADEKGVPSLDDLAAYALRNPAFSFDDMGSIYLMLFVPGAVTITTFDGGHWEALRLYGTLSTAQKAALREGGRLGIGGMSAPQQAILRRMVYGARSELTVERPGTTPPEEEPLMFGMGQMFAGGGIDFRDEPTEALPNDLPADGYLDAAVVPDFFAKMVDPPGETTMAFISVLGPDEMAFFRMLKGMPAQAGGALPSLDRLRVGRRTRLALALRLAPGLSVRKTLHDHSLTKDGPIVGEKELPPDFQKRIAQRLEALKKSPMGSMGEMGGGLGFPPPR